MLLLCLIFSLVTTKPNMVAAKPTTLLGIPTIITLMLIQKEATGWFTKFLKKGNFYLRTLKCPRNPDINKHIIQREVCQDVTSNVLDIPHGGTLHVETRIFIKCLVQEPKNENIKYRKILIPNLCFYFSFAVITPNTESLVFKND